MNTRMRDTLTPHTALAEEDVSRHGCCVCRVQVKPAERLVLDQVAPYPIGIWTACPPKETRSRLALEGFWKQLIARALDRHCRSTYTYTPCWLAPQPNANTNIDCHARKLGGWPGIDRLL